MLLNRTFLHMEIHVDPLKQCVISALIFLMSPSLEIIKVCFMTYLKTVATNGVSAKLLNFDVRASILNNERKKQFVLVSLVCIYS